MNKQLTIEFSSEWILQHRNDEVLPVAYLSQQLVNTGIYAVKDSAFAYIVIEFDAETHSEDFVRKQVFDILCTRYSNDEIKSTAIFRFDDVKETKELLDEDAEEKRLQADLDKFLDERRGRDSQAYTAKTTAATAQTAELSALEQIDKLVGANEFKEISHELALIATEVRERKTYDIFTSQSYLFSIGDGCGATTCLQLLARHINELNIKKVRQRRSVVEVKLQSVKESMEPFEDAVSELKAGDKDELRIMYIDISEWMNATENRFFKQFLRLAEKYSDCFIMIFRIPFVDKDILERIRASIDDVMYVRVVSFPPLTFDELQLAAKNDLQTYGFTVQKSAWNYFNERIALEKSDGKFYGISTVKKVVRELVYKKQLSNAQSGKSSSVISAKDMQKICLGDFGNFVSGEEQLKALIGNDKIRERINEILAQIDLAMKSDTERPCIHMRFIGNPGTGKTTVARILGKILKERGVLRIGNFYEYAGRDFCGRYVGETAPKTASMCRDAYGSVLFIDEAYTLYKEGSTIDYGREAIDTLIAEMENHRNDFVVIMAGYTDDMDHLMKGNLGLASRMPYTIEFPNFTRDELYAIYESMVKSKFKYDENLLIAVKEYFDNLPDEVMSDKSFSNARYVRNLFERTWAKASMRCQLDKKTDIVLTRDDFIRASSDAEFANKSPKRMRIGF